MDLAEQARLDPDELWAWMGNVKATSVQVTRLYDAVRWDFTWKFKRTGRFEDVEFIVDHELLHVKKNTWTGEEYQRNVEFTAFIVIGKQGIL